MKSIAIVIALGSVLLLSACSDEKVQVQKSPCVGLDNSPCGPKRPVNGKLNNMVENTQTARSHA